MPAPHHSVFYRPDALPATATNSVKALKAQVSGDYTSIGAQFSSFSRAVNKHYE